MKNFFYFVTISIVIFYSSLNAQWIQTNGPYGGSVSSFAVSGTNLFAGTFDGGVFLSTNNGTSWTAASTGLTNTGVTALAVSDTNLFAGIYGGYVPGGVFLSTNNGTSWIAASTGLTSRDVRAIAVSPNGAGGTNLFAGTGDGVWRRPISEMITGVEDQSTGIPSQFALEQNYPNPFNPSTNIEFRIANFGFVSLKVYDMLGKEVATLVNEEKPAGNYGVDFNAANLPSGVYFYRLQAGNFTETKKLILLR